MVMIPFLPIAPYWLIHTVLVPGTLFFVQYIVQCTSMHTCTFDQAYYTQASDYLGVVHCLSVHTVCVTAGLV